MEPVQDMRLPKISVVTPSFNQAQFIEKTIHSVLDQNYPNLEFIIMDGGSTDGSADIIRRYEDKLAYWVSQPDDGQTDALIKGFARSTGDIQCWLCSDDLFEPYTLHEVADFFMKNPQAEAVYGDSYWIGADDKPLRPKKEHAFSRFIWLYHENYLPQPSTFWRRGLYERVGGLDPSYRLAMDADLWIRFAMETEIHHVPRLWSRMRHYPEQKNRRLRDISNEEGKQIHRRYLGDKPEWYLGSARAVARSMRIGWKAATGCYW
jgi:glycosyltransferase involved in cell wall biosynthesis